MQDYIVRERCYIQSAWKYLVLVLILASISLGHAEPRYVELLNRLRPGMTQAEIIALLGEPSLRRLENPASRKIEFLYFRFAALARQEKGRIAFESRTFAGRIQCKFRDGVLESVSGIWPAPERPPSGVLKSKILLVDVVAIFDGLRQTATLNTLLREQEEAAQQKLTAINDAEKALVREHKEAESAARRRNVADTEKLALKKKAVDLEAMIALKRQEADKFTKDTRNRFISAIEGYRDLMLPLIADMIVQYKAAHGYDYVYELRDNVLAPGTKPLFVAGVDKTKEVIAWIDARCVQAFQADSATH